jgi:uncharacterized protein (TIGR02145 family)
MLNEQFGNYKFLSVLGEGGMATVYLAENTMLDSLVAIKVLKEEFVHNKNIRKRFLDEAKKMVKVKHPNIILVMDLIDMGDIVAIVMDYIDGQSLKEVIEKSGKLSNDEIKRLFSQILLALKHVHDAGFVHRDIKPSNFMLSKDGTIKLADFGIAKDKNVVAYTETGSQMGTPLYMSPEQIKSTKDVDHRSDIYSLGVVLYEMITGDYPHDKTTLSLPEIQVAIIKEALPHTHTLWDPQLQKATEKNEINRFQSCEEWLQALKQGITLKQTASAQSDNTIVETSASEKTTIEAHDHEKASENRPITEETVIEETPHNGIKPKTNESVALTPKKNRNILIYSLLGALTLVLIFLVFIIFKEQKIDGKKEDAAMEAMSFEEVTIGNQIWMAKNLDVSTFRNGDPIPEAKTNEEWEKAGENQQPAWCYYDNDPANGEKYGKLYNWYAVNDSRGLAPAGYHIPSDYEWTTLSDYLGGTADTTAGTKMKSISGWEVNGNGTNESGFSGLPGGCRDDGGTFYGIGEYGNWWSSTEFSTASAPARGLFYYNSPVGRHYDGKEYGLSVRCLRD